MLTAPARRCYEWGKAPGARSLGYSEIRLNPQVRFGPPSCSLFLGAWSEASSASRRETRWTADPAGRSSMPEQQIEQNDYRHWNAQQPERSPGDPALRRPVAHWLVDPPIRFVHERLLVSLTGSESVELFAPVRRRSSPPSSNNLTVQVRRQGRRGSPVAHGNRAHTPPLPLSGKCRWARLDRSASSIAAA